MLTTDVVAKQILGREFSGALPLPVLLERISAEKQSHPGGPEILLREVESRPDVFRVLHPFVGPWLSTGSRFPRAFAVDPWVLLLVPSATPKATRTETLLVETLRQVGTRVDGTSFTALARWLQLVMAAGEVRQALHSLAMNHPVRHSSSESQSTNVKPAPAVAA